jgi:DNA-binding transcriptional regulator LsrR (DeoR family)
MMNDTKRQEIALWWLDPLLRGNKERPQKELVKLFLNKYKQVITRSTIERAKREAFEKGLVEFRPNLIVPDSKRHAINEGLLSRKYNLLSSIVVKSEESSLTSDQSHTQLAYHTAQSIADAPGFFPENAVIGIGSGRAIHYLVESFRLLSKPFNVKNTTIMSLSGTIYPDVPKADFVSRQDQLLDADINAALFAQLFNQLTRVRTICFPIALHSVDAMRRNTWLYSPEDSGPQTDKDADIYASNRFSEHTPNFAFVGVGVLNRNHRLFREMQRPENDPLPSTMLDPIRDNLRELIHASQTITERYMAHASKTITDKRKGPIPYFPVADICHRLLFIDPPNEFTLATGEEDHLRSLINKVNTNMLTVTKRQLNKINNVVLIAGTEEKSIAIQRLLERNDPTKNKNKECPVIRTLCTDEATADRLLAAQ